MVLPPGEYNKKTLRSIMDMARKRQQTKHARRPTKESNTGSLTRDSIIKLKFFLRFQVNVLLYFTPVISIFNKDCFKVKDSE
jgi:uncharacterized membrane protein